MNKRSILATASIITLVAFNSNAANLQHEEIIVYGDAGHITTPGSADAVMQEEIELYNSENIHHILQAVPGVEGYDEDGYGNRPNIGMRGGKSERSQGITLMEDGILIAPAPYSAPSAYYFPKMERMQEIEVLKGAAALKYGPRTVNGAVNLITKDITEDRNVYFKGSVGSYESSKAELFASDTIGQYGFLVDLNQVQSNGFKDVDGGNVDSGFNIKDALLKFRVSSEEHAAKKQYLEIKYGSNDENSNASYLGLSDEDFADTPNRRYKASEKDNFDGQQQEVHVSHYIEATDNLSINTKAYYNDFNRNWYKLDKLFVDGDKYNLDSAITNQISFLKGEVDTTGDNTDYLAVKSNNRDYDSKGIATELVYESEIAGYGNQVELGLRYHEDSESRYQATDKWNIDSNGNFVLQESGAFGTSDSNNKEIKARAFSAFLVDEFYYGDYTIAPGARLEYIDLKKTERVSGTISKDTITEIMPGISLGYDMSEKRYLFAGVNKGFSPAIGFTDADQEESVNYEVGIRSDEGFGNYEIVAFFNDYKNLIGSCTESTGGDCVVGDEFNGGKVNSLGLEVGVGSNLNELAITRRDLPVKIAYTYTDAEFRTSFDSDYGLWGEVTKGDKVPYVAAHQFFASIGYNEGPAYFEIAGKYQSEMNTIADGSQQTDEVVTFDFASNYKLDHKDKSSLFVSVANIFDNEYVASRTPSGARPGAPRIAQVGFKYKF